MLAEIITKSYFYYYKVLGYFIPSYNNQITWIELTQLPPHHQVQVVPLHQVVHQHPFKRVAFPIAPQLNIL